MPNNSGWELAKLLSSLATPIVVLWLGVLVLRRIETIKSAAARQSEFQRKWADEFFLCCQEFLRALERELAALTALSTLSNLEQHDNLGKELQKEVSRLHPKISELELRIRRCVVFAPVAGPQVTEAAKECFRLVAELTASKQGDMEKIIEQMNTFNFAARKAHAEMLGINSN